MNKKIEAHINELFRDIPKEPNVFEIKEELLSNLNEKYNDLMAEGKSDDEAYSLAISSIGDINGLLYD